MKKEKYYIKKIQFFLLDFLVNKASNRRFLLPWIVVAAISASLVSNVYPSEQLPSNQEFYTDKADGSTIVHNGKNYKIKNTPSHRGLLLQDPKNSNIWRKQGIHYSYTRGEITLETSYVDDKKHGLEKRYQDGILFSETNYVNNLRDGLHTQYKGKDLVAQTKMYKNDKLHGIAVMMQQTNGKSVKYSETPWVENKMHGVYYLYDSYGEKVIETKVYDMGKIVTQK